jgi:hypothetical protein
MKLLITSIVTAVILSLSGPAARTVTVVGEINPLESTTLDWALDRYETAGISLPPFTIEFAGPDGCNGSTAIAIQSEPMPQVIMCAELTTSKDLVLKRTMLHEIAHIWAAEAIDQATKASFLTLRGLETWGSRDVPWHERGSEQAAEIMTWALIDRELLMATLADHDPDDLAAGYELLTGTPVPSRDL